MNILHTIIDTIEGLKPLDKAADPLAAVVSRAVQPRRIRNLLSGAAIGHSVHPVLIVVPSGAWLMASYLDFAGGKSSRHAADLLVNVGIVSAAPAVITGLHDWSDTQEKERRVGLVHAAGNAIALVLFTASSIVRLRDHRVLGKLLGLAGLGSMGFSAYLGGHLAYGSGVNVNRTAWHELPTEWTRVASDADVVEGGRHRTEVNGVPVLLLRNGGKLTAMDSVCNHLGGPLEEGTVEDGCIVCPWHQSTFRLDDGWNYRGPASVPQPVYETRVTSDGFIELRQPVS
ncbi:Rieske 2Fe-2S domain-containing protein [Arthrobacter sp. Br18]|uniref:Rieske 2Fe-2S domain-containing protein n=1 Tax=Arthrobacter sp. Br18 TaxID=1312954 RepID=UPI00047C7906|nr:Rieske 2Fe-2S domain-containing protein [Arthrobacter sp. Br18]